MSRIAVAAESDTGNGPIYRLALPKGAALDPALAGLATALAPIGVFIAQDPPRHAGSDIEGLEKAGVPVFEIGADTSRSFDAHHSADDTLDKVNRAALEQSVAAWAVVLNFLADSGVDLYRAP